MPVTHTTYPSAQAWLSDLTNNILPSNSWFVAKLTPNEAVFSCPAGGYVALINNGNTLNITAFRNYDPDVVVAEQSPFPGLPGIMLTDEPVETWTLINRRRVIVILRANNQWYSAYFGLLIPFGSTKTYPFPAFVGGSLAGSGFPFMAGGEGLCPKVCVPDGAWQVVGGEQGEGLGSILSFDYRKAVAYVHPFDGKNQRLGFNLDGSISLFRAMVVSAAFSGSALLPISGEWAGIDDDYDTADDGQWLGYLDGVYACPVGLAPGTVFDVGGVDHLVVGEPGRVFAVALS